MSEIEIATAFWFALRQIAGETPAFLPYFLLQKIVCLICPIRDNMLVEKQGQKYICPARDNMSIQP
ncbi:MAG: hypothetical protein LBP59_12075 [Planctomycetaceae bacterium]|nr:hypothetical protein [Planctomycetaceae bacterium]